MSPFKSLITGFVSSGAHNFMATRACVYVRIPFTYVCLFVTNSLFYAPYRKPACLAIPKTSITIALSSARMTCPHIDAVLSVCACVRVCVWCVCGVCVWCVCVWCVCVCVVCVCGVCVFFL